MKPCYAAMAALAAISLSAPGQASAAETATFRVGGVDFKLTLPAGFCLPSGQYLDVAQAVAASDNQNITDLTAYRCDASGLSADYPLLIKTPKSVLLTDVGRAELLSQMGAEFEKPEFAKALASGDVDKSSSEGLSAVLGDDVTVKSQVKPLGKDDVCAYLGGTIAIADKARASQVAVVGCLTAVKKRLVIVYAYGPVDGLKSILTLAPKAKAIASQLIRENE